MERQEGRGARRLEMLFDGHELVLRRVVQLAAGIARAEANVTMILDGEVRRYDAQGAVTHVQALSAQGALTMRDDVWIEDTRTDPLTAALPDVTGGAGYRFVAGARIITDDPSVVGVLWIAGPEPRARDAAVMEQLRALADLAAHDWRKADSNLDLAESAQAGAMSNRILLQVIETARLSVAAMDRDLRLIFASPKWAENRGRAHPGEIRGRHISELIPAHLFERYREQWERALAGEDAAPMTVALEEDGRTRWRQVRLDPLLSASGAIEALVMSSADVTDVTDALHHAEAATASKSAFLATMSHEIRTPLNGVLGMAQAMDAEPLEERQRARLTVIRQAGESLMAIVNDVLDLSKVEAGKMELELRDFDLAGLAREVQAAFEPGAQTKGVRLALICTRGVQGAWRGDAIRLRQVLANLVSNAIKFTDQGAVTLRIARRGGGVRLTVRDTGIGIDPATIARLFDKFEQADLSTTRRFGGTGLGLAICRELTTLMGGQIRAESQPGQGACFTVDLPLVRAGTAARMPDESFEASLEQLAALRILVAEDNPMNQLVLRTLLQQVGVEPAMVNDGVEVVAAAEAGPWDLILMDVQMPRMDGPDATREIRRRELAGGRARTPILALTANAMDHQVLGYAEAGMDGFVAKPIRVEELLQAICEAAFMPEPAMGDPADPPAAEFAS